MANKNQRRNGSKRETPVFEAERYSIKSLHEDREYGIYWYAWLWKIIRPILIFACSALVVVGIVSIGYNRVYDALFSPVSEGSAEVVTFEIENGESVSAIGRRLEEAQLVRSRQVFRYLVQLEGLTDSISYGTFKLSPSMNVEQVLAELTSGSQTNERVITIVPGWTCENIANYLVSIGALEDTQEFLTLCNDLDRFVGNSYALRDAQKNGHLANRKYVLEGYLAPDTYRVFTSATAESIIRTMLNQNNNVVDEVFYSNRTEYYADNEGLFHEVETYQNDLSIDELVTLASMIEKEAANQDDYARVSAVFHNRLRQGWKLESDPTVTYLSGVFKLALTEEEIASPSPYNTYYVTALPAGPICNPSKDALEAAKAPDLSYVEEGYLYFCAKEPTSGELVFSKTLEEHQANVTLYRPLWEAYDAQRAVAQQQQQ